MLCFELTEGQVLSGSGGIPDTGGISWGEPLIVIVVMGKNREAARVRSVSHAASGGVLDTGIDAGRISWGGWGGGLLVFLSIIPIGRALVQKHWENLGENPRV